MEEDEKITRHMVGIDAFSLLETDGAITDTEAIALGNKMYMDILKKIPTERQKFIAVALENGFSKVEVAYMLGLSCSVVSRETQKMKIVLKGFYKNKYSK